jgi:hypothetical protein
MRRTVPAQGGTNDHLSTGPRRRDGIRNAAPITVTMRLSSSKAAAAAHKAKRLAAYGR